MRRELVRRLVLPRVIVVVIGTLVMTAMCANTDPRLLVEKRDVKVVPTATIVDSPLTVGLADSNLLRLKTHAEIDRELDMMQSIGVKNIRIGLYWAEIEPLKDVYRWSNADYIVNQAYKRGLGVLATLNETPAWAGTPLGSGTPDTADFATWATTIAQRYKGKISAIEVWNEPNARFFLNPVSPENYTALLKAGYTAIKAVDPSITVVGGVLGSGRTIGELTMNPVDFLQGMYSAGAKGYFDALSFHPYKFDMKYSNQQNQADSPLLQFEDLRAMMNENGDNAVKIWASEYGLPTSTSLLGVSQQHQADFIKDFLYAWGKQAGTGPIFLYTTRDIKTGDALDGDNYGLWETDWTPKPAVKVVQDFIFEHTSPLHPILNAIRNIIAAGVHLVGSVITGIVNFVVGVTKAIAAAVVWVVKTTAKVVVGVTKGIVNLVNSVVSAVIGGIRHIFGVAGATATAAAKTKGAAASAAVAAPTARAARVKPSAAAAHAADAAETDAVQTKDHKSGIAGTSQTEPKSVEIQTSTTEPVHNTADDKSGTDKVADAKAEGADAKSSADAAGPDAGAGDPVRKARPGKGSRADAKGSSGKSLTGSGITDPTRKARGSNGGSADAKPSSGSPAAAGSDSDSTDSASSGSSGQQSDHNADTQRPTSKRGGSPSHDVKKTTSKAQ